MIEYQGVVKTHRQGKREIRALDGVSFKIDAGEMVAITGPSGSGKSTLLHLTGTLDLPTSGRVLLSGKDTAALTDAERTLLRRRDIGFVFQFFHLIPSLSVRDNVALPLLLDGAPKEQVRQRSVEMLERVGLRARLTHLPEELSGGEMQRAAIARALVTDPRILLVDEPTGNLDSVTGAAIIKLITEFAKERRTTVVVVTHDENIAACAERVVRLRDGRIDECTAGTR